MNPPYLRAARVLYPEPPEPEPPPKEAKEEEGHWADYWFEGPPEEEGAKKPSTSTESAEAAAPAEPTEPTEAEEEPALDPTKYPFNLSAVQALEDIDFGTVTILVGDNGSGKSTLIEGLAIAAGFNPEGGSRNLKFETNDTHSPLADHLSIKWNARPRWGWFFRAETYYGMATHIEGDTGYGVASMFPDLHNKSHGESFLELTESRMRSKGLYFLDEIESALSFHGQMRLLLIMKEAVADGAQFIIATHSPLLMAYPGATVIELDNHGASHLPFEQLDAVQLWRRFLNQPHKTIGQLFEDE